MNESTVRALCSAALAAAAAMACSGDPAPSYQGYVEGEYFAVASSEAGHLVQLAVSRGEQVAAGALLFKLEADSEVARERQAAEQLRAAQAQLADLQTGRRREEADVVRAQLAQASAEQVRAAAQARRDEVQWRSGVVSLAQREQSQAAAIAAAQRVRELQSQLKVAALPGREAQLRAQSALVEAARAALSQAQWQLRQKQWRAPQAGLVADTLYREGEWVAAGQPVLRLLPPGNVKVRFFAPQSALPALRPGRAVELHCDGCDSPLPAAVSHVATQAEYTPPVIYSADTRAKLVFMIEALPRPQDAAKLAPGQPVQVWLR